MTTRSLLQTYWLPLSLAALVAVVLAAIVYIVATLPPRTIVMATGPEGGANYELGARYREILSRSESSSGSCRPRGAWKICACSATRNRE